VFNVTVVFANALPFNTAPAPSEIDVWDNIVPLNVAVAPMVAWPPTCQKTFLACAEPLRMTVTPLATVRSCAIWRIQTSFVLVPERVTLVGIETPVAHL
jgi:hypothetical protein